MTLIIAEQKTGSRTDKTFSILKADLAAFNKEILRISKQEDCYPWATTPCCTNKAR